MDQAERDLDPVRADHDAHNHVMSMDIGDVVSELVDLLGATTVAAIGGVNETRAVQEWLRGREPQRHTTLRFALQLGAMIAQNSEVRMARAWFEASNPHLDDKVPLLMLRNEPLNEIQRPLMRAARAFSPRRRP